MLAAVYCRFLITASLPASLDWQTWVSTAPIWEGFSGEVDDNGRLTHQFGRYAHARLTVRYNLATGRVSVAGALQSYWQGSNVGLFHWHEVLAACQSVADAIQLPAKELRVSLLETGVTVATGQAPTDLIKQLQRAHYGPQQAPFYATEPPANCSQPLQYVARTNELRVKLYDKGTYAALKGKPLPTTGNGFRFELHYLKSRRIGAALSWNGAITWANLMQADVYACLAAKLLEGWKNIHLPAPMDTPNLTIDERALLIAGQDPAFWEASKRVTPEATYKRRRALFNKLQRAQAGQVEATNSYTSDVELNVAASLPK
jgi:hypothetical protein